MCLPSGQIDVGLVYSLKIHAGKYITVLVHIFELLNLYLSRIFPRLQTFHFTDYDLYIQDELKNVLVEDECINLLPRREFKERRPPPKKT